MNKLILAVLLVLITIYVVPFVAYGAAGVLGGMQPRTTASPGGFLLGVLLTKLGTAIAFVALFAAARAAWGDKWLLYSLVWFVMFAFSEIGDVVSGRSTRTEAMLGVVSEAVYTPVAALLVHRLLARRTG